ncbi:BTAD domain-containing putative transcriptional regulator [Lentzea sp. NBRC 105346]|uniref:BTAD domain-containing putative transcriptional regulator n=1 Tax=Lentzea sp. NBRC 105346 TaxID=3032205 RepID=UPI00255411D9|nr:BTAD domain-containing putative transcriptional regulator [Lentzea sp. NBRC 105346]
MSGKRLRWLLIRLAMEPGRVVPAERLIADLWGDEPPGDGAASLQSAVSRLRKALPANVIVSQHPGYYLDVPPENVDVHRFERTLDPALWRGEPFEGAPFARQAAARLSELRRDVVGLEQLAAENPLREDLQARLMLTLHESGRRSDALAVYERTREALSEELGVSPGAELAEAHLTVLRTEPQRRKGNLPAPVSSFIGRTDDVERVSTMLNNHRLVTLTGFGGVGKTRLALEYAADAGEAWLVELDSASDPEAALDAALGPNPLGVDPLSRLGECLVVLDNCEHVVETAAAFCARLLAAAPGVRVLATSREPLGIPGEVVHPVTPLPEEQAVELFSARVGGSVAGAELLCRELDGIPLALELAAARARTLTMTELTSRLDSRLRLLDRGVRTGPARHRTLRAVIDWSWELLSPEERDFLARLSVFAGSATAEAIAIVTGAGDLWAALDVLSALVDKSLVVRSGDRFRLLETVREYAAERLTEAEPRFLHAVHYSSLAARLEPVLRSSDQLSALAVFEAERANLDAALEFLVSRKDFPIAARLVANRAWHWLVITRRFGEMRRWAARIPGDPLCLALSGDIKAATELWDTERPTALCALLLTSGGTWGQQEVAPKLFDLAFRLGDTDDPWMRGFSALLQGVVAGEFSAGSAHYAEEMYEDALDAFREIGDRWAISFALSCLALVLINRGAFAEALSTLEEARTIAASLGEVLVPMSLLVQTSRLRARLGDFDGARADLDRAGAPADTLERARMAQARADIAYFSGDFAAAESLYRATLAVEVMEQVYQFRSTVHTGLALTLTRLGRLDEARAAHTDALNVVSSSADGPARALVWEGYADWLGATGDFAGALRALDKAVELRGAIPNSDPAVVALRDRCLAEVGVDG